MGRFGGDRESNGGRGPATVGPAVAAVLATLLSVAPVAAQFELDKPPIDYFQTAPDDPVARLQKQLAARTVQLDFDARHGYLPSLLRRLDVPVSSQTLVFSKTSLQVKYISPRSPRAIYFNDDVYVGWVQGGDLEISAVDPQLGANFYLLGQYEAALPRMLRKTYDCLQCHSGALTRDVPGHIVRSTSTGPDGHVSRDAETVLVDDTTPLRDRFGGWYVTGLHGAARHHGNRFVRVGDDPAAPDLDAGANARTLDRWTDTVDYLSPHSDLVAHLVLAHQAALHNRIARAGFLARVALARDGSAAAPETARSLDAAAEPVVEGLLFGGAAPLTEPAAGTSTFAADFSARGPRDAQGRSLRDFDLRRRLFRYPCSYLIYSQAFQELPRPLRERIYRRLLDVLLADSPPAPFERLTVEDRRAILEIVTATVPDLPDFWRASSGAAPAR